MEYNEILEKQIVGRLRIDNPWWKTGEILSDYNNMTPRLYLNIFYPLVTDLSLRRALILMGPRRVGKTVMIYHTIQRLIDNGVSPQNIIYVSVETPIYNKILLEQLFILAKRALNKDKSQEQFYVFYDEIQYLKGWEIDLKSLVDTYHNVKFIASGSAAAELKQRSNESGAGRFTDFNLPPLLFYEYIHLLHFDNLMNKSEIEWRGHRVLFYSTSNILELNKLLLDYINYGGYPEVVFSETIKKDPEQFIRHDIIDKVLLRDLPSLYGITDVQELNSLFNMIAYRSGDQFSYQKLAEVSGVKKDTLKKYIQYLEAAFLIKLIHRTDDTARSFKRDVNFKIYLTNPSLRCALFEPITEEDDNMGNIIETAVYSQWIPRGTEINYANWKKNQKVQGEVDMVGINKATQKPDWIVEIKWSDAYYNHPYDLVSLQYFMQKNKIPYALVTSITKLGRQDTDFGILQFVPVADYIYTVGENTLNMTKKSFGL